MRLQCLKNRNYRMRARGQQRGLNETKLTRQYDHAPSLSVVLDLGCEMKCHEGTDGSASDRGSYRALLDQTHTVGLQTIETK